MTDPAAPPPPDPAVDGDALIVEAQLFSIVPERVIESGISDPAFRLYALLLRYGNDSGVRMPSRPTLARRLHRSTDSVDRAMRNLEEQGLVVVEHRRSGGVNLSNRYFVRTTPPPPPTPPPSTTPTAPDNGGGGRRSAATPTAPGARTTAAADPVSSVSPDAGPAGVRVAGAAMDAVAGPRPPGGGSRRSAATRRSSAARVAADLRPDPEISTQRTPPPPPPPALPASQRAAREEEATFLTNCGLDGQTGLADVAARCAAARAAHGLGATCWQPPHLLAALHRAVHTRLWPQAHAVAALVQVAADPATKSPMRLAEAGPWWDEAAAQAHQQPVDAEVDALEARLQALDGGRLVVQQQARAELVREGMPLTRSTVFRRACEILDRRKAS